MISIIHLFAVTADKLPQASLDQSTIKTVLQFVFGVASAIALLIIVIASFKYVISRGDSNAIKNAKETIIYAIVGLILTISAYAITQFAFNGVKS